MKDVKEFVKAEARKAWRKFKKNKPLQINIICFMCGVILTLVMTRAKNDKEAAAAPEVTPTVTIIQSEQTTPTEHQVNYDAVCLARVLYGVKDYQLPDAAKKAIIEVIFNRAACTYGEFGDTIAEVCNKPQQWQGYNSDGDYLESDYNLALSKLNDTSGARVIPEGCYFVKCETGAVTVRTEWSESSNSWRVGS